MRPVSRNLEAIRQRLAAASPSPWVLDQEPDGTPFIRTGSHDHVRRLYVRRDNELADSFDVAFIARAHEALDRLATALEKGEFDSISWEELDEIEALAAAATPGPWTPFLEGTQPIGGCSVIWVAGLNDAPDMYLWLDHEMAPDEDFEFVAHAREDVPHLIAEIRRLKSR